MTKAFAVLSMLAALGAASLASAAPTGHQPTSDGLQEHAAQAAPDAVRTIPEAAKRRTPSPALEPPRVFLPPTSAATAPRAAAGSGGLRPLEPWQAAGVVHRVQRHSSTIFNSPAVEAPRRYRPVQPGPPGPTPLKRRTFEW